MVGWHHGFDAKREVGEKLGIGTQTLLLLRAKLVTDEHLPLSTGDATPCSAVPWMEGDPTHRARKHA